MIVQDGIVHVNLGEKLKVFCREFRVLWGPLSPGLDASLRGTEAGAAGALGRSERGRYGAALRRRHGVWFTNSKGEFQGVRSKVSIDFKGHTPPFEVPVS